MYIHMMNENQKRYLEKRMNEESNQVSFQNWLKQQPRSVQLKWMCGWKPNMLIIFNNFKRNSKEPF